MPNSNTSELNLGDLIKIVPEAWSDCGGDLSAWAYVHKNNFATVHRITDDTITFHFVGEEHRSDFTLPIEEAITKVAINNYRHPEVDMAQIWPGDTITLSMAIHSDCSYQQVSAGKARITKITTDEITVQHIEYMNAVQGRITEQLTHQEFRARVTDTATPTNTLIPGFYKPKVGGIYSHNSPAFVISHNGTRDLIEYWHEQTGEWTIFDVASADLHSERDELVREVLSNEFKPRETVVALSGERAIQGYFIGRTSSGAVRIEVENQGVMTLDSSWQLARLEERKRLKLEELDDDSLTELTLSLDTPNSDLLAEITNNADWLSRLMRKAENDLGKIQFRITPIITRLIQQKRYELLAAFFLTDLRLTLQQEERLATIQSFDEALSLQLRQSPQLLQLFSDYVTMFFPNPLEVILHLEVLDITIPHDITIAIAVERVETLIGERPSDTNLQALIKLLSIRLPESGSVMHYLIRKNLRLATRILNYLHQCRETNIVLPPVFLQNLQMLLTHARQAPRHDVSGVEYFLARYNLFGDINADDSEQQTLLDKIIFGFFKLVVSDVNGALALFKQLPVAMQLDIFNELLERKHFAHALPFLAHLFELESPVPQRALNLLTRHATRHGAYLNRHSQAQKELVILLEKYQEKLGLVEILKYEILVYSMPFHTFKDERLTLEDIETLLVFQNKENLTFLNSISKQHSPEAKAAILDVMDRLIAVSRDAADSSLDEGFSDEQDLRQNSAQELARKIYAAVKQGVMFNSAVFRVEFFGKLHAITGQHFANLLAATVSLLQNEEENSEQLSLALSGVPPDIQKKSCKEVFSSKEQSPTEYFQLVLSIVSNHIECLALREEFVFAFHLVIKKIKDESLRIKFVDSLFQTVERTPLARALFLMRFCRVRGVFSVCNGLSPDEVATVLNRNAIGGKSVIHFIFTRSSLEKFPDSLMAFTRDYLDSGAYEKLNELFALVSSAYLGVYDQKKKDGKLKGVCSLSLVVFAAYATAYSQNYAGFLQKTLLVYLEFGTLNANTLQVLLDAFGELDATQQQLVIETCVEKSLEFPVAKFINVAKLEDDAFADWIWQLIEKYPFNLYEHFEALISRALMTTAPPFSLVTRLCDYPGYKLLDILAYGLYIAYRTREKIKQNRDVPAMLEMIFNTLINNEDWVVGASDKWLKEVAIVFKLLPTKHRLCRSLIRFYQHVQLCQGRSSRFRRSMPTDWPALQYLAEYHAEYPTTRDAVETNSVVPERIVLGYFYKQEYKTTRFFRNTAENNHAAFRAHFAGLVGILYRHALLPENEYSNARLITEITEHLKTLETSSTKYRERLAILRKIFGWWEAIIFEYQVKLLSHVMQLLEELVGARPEEESNREVHLEFTLLLQEVRVALNVEDLDTAQQNLGERRSEFPDYQPITEPMAVAPPPYELEVTPGVYPSAPAWSGSATETSRKMHP